MGSARSENRSRLSLLQRRKLSRAEHIASAVSRLKEKALAPAERAVYALARDEDELVA
jgi:hypothetical protein